MGSRNGTVYALVDPADPGRFVYVGSTVMYLKQRLGVHLADARLNKPPSISQWT
jgi:hypothetical protein